MEITKTMTVGQVCEKYPEASEILKGFGVTSFCCPSSRKQTIEEVCMVHGIDVEELLKKLAGI